MNKKLKWALLGVEVFVLVVLLLLCIVCQQKWIIITGDGPRFDWYAIQEDLAIDIQGTGKLEKMPDSSHELEPESSAEPEPTVTTAPPASSAPPTPGNTEQEDLKPGTTEPPDVTEDQNPPPSTDNWETEKF